ncbi:hypothetical protein [Inquilinus sp.]|jgi:catechol 1,2-dioxygenase|uniref:dioxygenase family protein n=1 Tax=Inquilinus sp. TaxID=1932117 RepID=UPI003783E3FC
MPEDRIRTVLEDLERVLLRFMRHHGISHQEYRRATGLLLASIRAGEGSLLLDIFLEAQAADTGNLGRTGSPEAIEGPFYVPGAPQLSPPHILPQRPDEAGDILVFRGRVTGPEGEPVAGVELDMWQADAAGLYSNVHPGVPDWNLRGCFRADAAGWFEVRTIVPPPYEIPKGGPAGRVLAAMERHVFRPAHLHLKLRHPAYEALTSQLYFRDGLYLESDVAHAVRPDCIASLVRREGRAQLLARGLDRPFFEVRHDFVLAPRPPAPPVAGGGRLAAPPARTGPEGRRP